MGVLVIIVLVLIFFLVFSLTGGQKENPAESDTPGVGEQTEEEQVLDMAQNMNPEEPGEYEIVEKKKRENNETVYILEDVNTNEQYTYVVEENGDIYLEFNMHTSASEEGES